MKKSIRKLMSFVIALFMTLQVILPAFPSKAGEFNEDLIKNIDEMEVDPDIYFSITQSYKLYDLKKTKKDESKFSISLGLSDKTTSFTLISRKDLNLFERGYFDSLEEVSKEYNRVKKNLNDQGLDIDISIIEDEEGYRIVDEKTYQDINEGKEDEKLYGENYNALQINILDDFDFGTKGYTKFVNEENKLYFNLDFNFDQSLDLTYNLFEQDQDGNINIKNDGDILAVINNNLAKKYNTHSLKEDISLLDQYRLERKEAEEEKKEESKEDTKEETKENKKEETKEDTQNKEEAQSKDEISNFEKADKELKKALSDPKNNLEEIQKLLHELGGKYKLTKEEEEKLMKENDKAIKDLVEKDRKENFRPLNLKASNSFTDKVFHLNPRITLQANSTNPIPKGWYFDVNIGPYLKLTYNYNDDPIKDLKDTNGEVIAKAEYLEGNESDKKIRYTIQKDIKTDKTITIDQNLSFDTFNIGSKSPIAIDLSIEAKGQKLQNTITVYKDSASPVEFSNSFKVDEQVSSATVYPYKLSYTSKQRLLDNDGIPVSSNVDKSNLNVEWDIEVDTSALKDDKLDFNNLNLSLFSSANQGLENFKFKVSNEEIPEYVNDKKGYKDSGSLGEIFEANESIAKNTIGDKLYIRVIAKVDQNKPIHPSYSMGIRINPDKNYIEKITQEALDEFKSIPTLFKWINGIKEAQTYASTPFNLLEESIVAENGAFDNFIDENFYYDKTRTIVADRRADNKIDWYALDLLRLGEKEDNGLESPKFDPNNITKNNMSKVYFIPKVNGGYEKTTDVNRVKFNGSYYPGTLVSYTYKNQTGGNNANYTLKTNIKEKTDDPTKGYYDSLPTKFIELHTQKVKQPEDGYFAYYENPFGLMRIDKNFDMAMCFNFGPEWPTREIGRPKVVLQKRDRPKGDYLIGRLNEKWNQAHNNYSLERRLQQGGDLSIAGKSKGEAMEDLMKRIFFYAEIVKERYRNGSAGKDMNRRFEFAMLQKVIHHYTDGMAVTNDAYISEDQDNLMIGRDHTLIGGFSSRGDAINYFEGDKRNSGTKNYVNRDNANLRKLKDNEKIIEGNVDVKRISDLLAIALRDLVKDSYKNDDWNEEKANSVNLTFYSIEDNYKTRYQDLIAGYVYEPIEIEKVDLNGKKVTGAKFTFTNIYTNENFYYESGKKDNKVYLKPGLYQVSEEAPKGYEKIAPFEIEIERKELDPDNGPYKQHGLDRIHVNNGYETTLSIDKKPNPVNGKEIVEIDKNNKLKLKITNIESNVGKLEFTKKNENNIALDGSEFTLRKLKATTKEAAINNPTDYDRQKDKTLVYEEVSKGKEGKFTFSAIREGYYSLEETKVPIGYEKAKTYIIEAKLVKDYKGEKKIKVNFIDQSVLKKDGNEIINKAKKTEIKFRKVDEKNTDDTDTEHLGLEDAIFSLTSRRTVDGSTYRKEDITSKLEDTKQSEEKIDGEQSKNGGYITFKDLTVGEYVLKEIKAPNGYEKTKLFGWKLVVTEENNKLVSRLFELENEDDFDKNNLEEIDIKSIIKSDEESGRVDAYLIGNEPRKVDTEFYKYLTSKDDHFKPIKQEKKLLGEDGKPVRFSVYNADYYGAQVGDTPYIKDIIADEKGVFHIKGLNFSSYYLLVEENPPAGYKKAQNILLKVEAEAVASEGKMKVVVRDINSNTIKDDNLFLGVLDFKDEPGLGKFSIIKTGNAIKPYSGKVGLRRAYFRLYEADNDFEILMKNGHPVSYSQEATKGEPITNDKNTEGKDPSLLPDNQGILTFDNIKPGKYVLEEYRGPAGYEKDPNPWYVLVKGDGTVIKSREKIEDSLGVRSFTKSSRLAFLEKTERNVNLMSENIVLYTVDSKNATIEVTPENVDETEGTREVSLKITPKTELKEITEEKGKSIHAVIMVDRGLDYSTNISGYRTSNIDNNINKFINDLVDKANKKNAKLKLSIIEYSDNKTKIRVLVDAEDPNRLKEKANTIDFKLVRYYKNEKGIYQLDFGNSQEVEKIPDYLEAAGVSNRENTLTKNLTNFNNFLSKTYSDVGKNENYDEKYVFNFMNYVEPRAKKQYEDLSKNIEDKFENKGYKSYMLHRTNDDEYSNNYAYENYMKNNGRNRVFELYELGKRAGGNQISKFGPYVEKETLDKVINNDDNFVDKKTTTTKEISLLTNGRLDIGVNNNIEIESIEKSKNNGPLQKVDTNTIDFPFENAPWQNGDYYTVKYKVKLKKEAEDNKNHKIHSKLNWILDKDNANNFVNLDTKKLTVRRHKEETPPEIQTDRNLTVNFNYFNLKDDGKRDKDIPEGVAGKVSLEVKENGKWLEISNSKKDVGYEDSKKFDISSEKDYRVVFETTQGNASLWGTQTSSYYPLKQTEPYPNGGYSIDISTGNLLEVFNKDEDGFRIPLRVTKKSEIGEHLSGAQFRARKLIDGDKIKAYKKDENGNPIKNDDGLVLTDEYVDPKYSKEPFDAVSEATGETGDNYIRELSPGIYELFEQETPSSAFKAPTDKDGNPMKWYFKVEVDNKKLPNEENYMKIIFNFKHTFSRNDEFNKNISQDEINGLLGKTVYGPEYFNNHTNELDAKDFTKYIKIVKDDERSNPARPDAPYKHINDAEVTNYKKETKFNFFKVDKDNKVNIRGAKFRLSKVKTDKDGNIVKDNNQRPVVETWENEQTHETKPVYQKTSISSSLTGVEFDEIEEGFYILEEVEPAKGYVKKENAYLVISFKVNSENASWEKKVVENKDFDEKTLNNVVYIYNKKATIDFKFIKVKDDGSELGRREFKLTKVDKDGKEIVGEGSYSKTITNTSEFGRFSFNDLTEGRYKLEERATLEGYQTPDPWFINIKANVSTGELEIEFENKDSSFALLKDDENFKEAFKDGYQYKLINFKKTDFSFKKVNEKNDALSNVVFTLKKVRNSLEDNSRGYSYSKYGDFEGSYEGVYKEGETIPDSKVGRKEAYFKETHTNKEGLISFSDLTEGIYELEETGIPLGYESDRKQFRWIIKVEKNKKLEVKYDKNVEDEYYKKYDSKYYEKYSTNNFKDKTNLSFNEGEYQLKNTKSTTSLKWKKYSNTSKAPIREDVKFTLYKYSEDPEDFTNLDLAQADGEKTREVISSDGQFEIEDLTKGLYALVETETPEGFKDMDKNIGIQIFENENGSFTKEFFEFKFGKAKIEEKVDDPQKFTYIWTNNGEIRKDNNSEITILNFEEDYFSFNKGYLDNNAFKGIKEGKLKLKLYPENISNAEKEKIPEKEFDLKNVSFYKFNLSNIKDGNYILEETLAPNGYQKTSHKYKINFTRENRKLTYKLVAVIDKDGKEIKNDKGELINDQGQPLIDSNTQINIVNNPLDIEFTKVDMENNPLSGASFELLGSDTPTPSEDSKGFVKIQEVNSDEFGKIKFKNLNDGYYKIKETKAPDGFRMPEGFVREFKIHNSEITVLYNNEEVKPDDKNNLLKIYNEKNPNIYFEKVDSKDNKIKLEGASFRLEKKFDGKYQPIDKNGEKATNESSYWTERSDYLGKFSFENLKDGDYLVRETKAPEGYANLKPEVYKFKVEKAKVYKVDLDNEKADKDELVSSSDKRIEVKNIKTEYPTTGGPGVWIGYSLIGIALMSIGVLTYFRKKQVN